MTKHDKNKIICEVSSEDFQLQVLDLKKFGKENFINHMAKG